MAEEVKYRRLSLEGTLTAGLSIIVVTFLIMVLCAAFVSLAFVLQEKTEGATEFTCKDGRTILAAWVGDGENDCLDGSDETDVASEVIEGEKIFGTLSYMMFAIAGFVAFSGILGLSTKILADSISAGLALHAANGNINSDHEDKIFSTDADPVQVTEPVEDLTPQENQ